MRCTLVASGLWLVGTLAAAAPAIAADVEAAQQREAAAALLKFLRSPKVTAVIKAKGMKDFGSDVGSE